MEKLHRKTLSLARKTKMPVSEICKKAKIKERWFYAFREKKYPDPGVNKTERLYMVLKK